MRRLLLMATLMAITIAACGDDDGDRVGVSTRPPAVQPMTGEVSTVASELVLSADAALSPSGEARVAPVGGQWCLEDPTGVRCVDAAAEGSAAHGIQWRPDETAIAVTWGAQDPISIVDFEAGTAVETDLDANRVLAWSPDGSQLLGLDIDRPGELSLLEPSTLEPSTFAPFTAAGVPQLWWPTENVVWGSVPGGPEVFTLSTDGSSGGEVVTIAGGLGEQLLVSVTVDGGLALTLDDEVERGVPEPGDTALRLFAREVGRSEGVGLPPGMDQRAPRWAQLSHDGRVLLVLHEVDGGGTALSSASVDVETLAVSDWATLAEWAPGDIDRPITYAANGIFRWDGGDTAWMIAESGSLLEVALG